MPDYSASDNVMPVPVYAPSALCRLVSCAECLSSVNWDRAEAAASVRLTAQWHQRWKIVWRSW